MAEEITLFGLVTIEKHRWYISIRGDSAVTGEPVEYIASNDSFYTEGDGIFFATRQEYDDYSH